MTKKILSGALAILMMVITSVMFVGCSGKDNYSNEAIASNGGIAVIKDGYMYYIAGGTDQLKEPTEEMVNASSIYKRPVDEAGNPIDSGKVELVYKGIAGFTYGELYMFGDYLYFATPSGKISNTASKMTDRTSFCRVRKDGKKYEVLYTTETKDKLKYQYYNPTNEELYLVILEGTELYSINIKKDKKIELSSDVSSVAFSSDLGRGAGADPYIFYTKAPEESYLTQTGSIVYKTLPNGEGNIKIASGADYALYEVKFGYLYFSVDGKIYRTTTQAGLDRTNIVSYEAFTTAYFTNNGGVVAVGTESGQKKYQYVLWENNVKVGGKILNSSEKYQTITQVGDYIYAINEKNQIVKLALDYGNTEDGTKTAISDKVTVAVGDYLKPEIVGDYMYFYVETKTTDANGNEISTWNLDSVKL